VRDQLAAFSLVFSRMADPLSNKMLNRSEKLDARGDAILDGTLGPQRGLIGDALKAGCFRFLTLTQ
jgi:hypothetical protein